MNKYHSPKYDPHRNPNAPGESKDINVAFILLNKDKLNLKQMADELGVSKYKISQTIKEYKIEYPKKYECTKKDKLFGKKKIQKIKHF